MSTTIVALATPPGIGAIHVIRISGKDAFRIVNQITKDKVEKTEDRIQITFLKSRNNQFLDQVVLAKFFAPYSYTGEDCVEISCHGNNLISKLIIDELIKHGAVQAERGEFTKRAFLNNKIDLNQAINIGNLFRATNELEIYSSVQEIMGSTSKLINGYLDRIFHLISECELNIDYPDELDRESNTFLFRVINSIKDLYTELNTLFVNSQKQKLSNYRVVFIGNSNAGKSSLINYLIGKERIIVSDRAGTTTDSIEVDWCFENYILTLVDTAGLDNVKDLDDYEFAKRTKLELDSADLLIHLTSVKTLDSDRNKEFWKDLIGEKSCIFVETKNDLCLDSKPVNSISVNNKDISFLIEQLGSFLEKNYKLVGIKSSWGINHLRNSCLELEKALSENLSVDLIVEHLHIALDSLSKIIGVNISTSEKINMMFDAFCVGK